MREVDEKIFKELEELREEYQKLDKKRIETETRLKTLREQLQQLKERARASYGTDNLEELKALLARWRRENEEKVKAYHEHISQIKRELATLEERENGGFPFPPSRSQ